MHTNLADANVAILVTTYNANIADLVGNIDSYLSQVKYVIVVDNSEDAMCRRNILSLMDRFPNILVKQLSRNVGIAAAQNIGFLEATALGSEFVVEMDQDSKLPEGYISSLLLQYVKLSQKGIQVGGLGPLAVSKDSDEVYDGLARSGNVIEVEYTLSSGFLMHVDAIAAVGPKNEKLFIDFVDWEWCWRSRSLGYRIFIDATLEISHMLGDGHKKILGLSIGMPSPIRHYYQFRNFIYLLGQRVVPLKWKLKYSVITLAKLVLIPLVFDRRIKRLGYALKGIKDALRGVYGKIGE